MIDFFVDDYRKKTKINGYLSLGVWSHLFCDPQNHDALVQFGEKIGLKESWVQHPGIYKEHFEVTESMRLKAIDAGAIPITTKKASKIVKLRRNKTP